MNIIVKVGSQSLLDATGGLDHNFMADLIYQIAMLKQQGHTVYLVSSGAVAAGKDIWDKSTELSETASRQILSGLGQAKLMQTYKEIADRHQLFVVQLLLSKNDFISRNHYLNVERLLLSMQEFPELLPIINENDSVAIDELMFTDNDQLAGVLAEQLYADLLILLTEAAGVYDKEPQEKDAQVFRLLGPKSGIEKWPKLEGRSNRGRGGISSKLDTAHRMSQAGLFTNIASARQPQIVVQVASAVEQLITIENQNLNSSMVENWRNEWYAQPEFGTLVLPVTFLASPSEEQSGAKFARGKLRGVRKWLSARNLAAGHGRITVNECLEQKLLLADQNAISILPIGIAAFEGEFSKGDLIDIYSTKKEKLGIGLARYGHMQLRKVIKKQNQAVFIHYNYLYVERFNTRSSTQQ